LEFLVGSLYIFSFELSSVKDMSEVIANDPHYVVELALDAFL